MNAPIVRIYAFFLILFATLVALTSNWSVFQASELEANADNRRPLLEEQRVARGEIRSSDDELLAESVRSGKGERRQFTRDYPTGELFAHPVGYSFIEEGRTGIEQSFNDTLVGNENEFLSIVDQIRGRTEEGSDLTLTLDAGAQELATELLGAEGAPGALVAIEPATGAVRAMASTPSYDPNAIPEQIDALNNPPEGTPPVLINRATQNPYPPGSTMKVVTAAAALDSGEYTPDSVVDGSSPIDVSGVPLENFGGESFGEITLTEALTNSVNTVWAQVGEDLGTETMVEYMERFGFYETADLQYPESQMRASGPTRGNRLVKSGFDVGRVAIGQGGGEGQMLATPLQMALVAATVANGGVQMNPTFLQEVTDPDGRVSAELDPSERRRVISSTSAEQLTQMMVNVTNEGTAMGLTVDAGEFAGKTGTAERDRETSLNQPWFVMFAPAEDPQIAIAATIETCQGCFGGEVAGPIATAVADELLSGGGG
ncbi:MAG: peptidoglycan D,D-transpeptidase FtsI family protein [Solirubrobacterales bacterium]